MSVRRQKDKWGKTNVVVDRRWPDGSRFRRLFPTRRLAEEVDARIKAAICGAPGRNCERILYGARKPGKLPWLSSQNGTSKITANSKTVHGFESVTACGLFARFSDKNRSRISCQLTWTTTLSCGKGCESRMQL